MENQNPSTPSQEAVSEPKLIANPKHFRAFWPIVLIAVMSALIGGLIVWVAYNQGLDEELNSLLPGGDRPMARNQSKDSTFEPMVAQGEESSPNTASWKTYRNEEYGFEIQHPADWKLNVSESGGLKNSLPLRIGWDTGSLLKVALGADYHTFDYAESHVGFVGKEEISGRNFSFANLTNGKLYAIAGTDNRTFFFELENIDNNTQGVEIAKSMLGTLKFTK